MEDEEVNMKTKKQMSDVFSSLIEVVHVNFHPSNFSFKIKGKGTNDSVSDREILDKLNDLRDTVAALQVLEKIINGEYGTSEEGKKLKKAELSHLNHLSKGAVNAVQPEIMKDLFEMSDQIRLNRSIFFSTVFRAPDYEKPQQNESNFYPSEAIDNILNFSNLKTDLIEQESGNTDYIKKVKEEAEKIQNEIDFWAPKILQVFGSKARDAIQTLEDSDNTDQTEMTRSKDIEALLNSSQKRVSGIVTFSLQPGNLFIEGINSKYSLLSATKGVYGESAGEWTAEDTLGFAKILSLTGSLQTRAAEK